MICSYTFSVPWMEGIVTQKLSKLVENKDLAPCSKATLGPGYANELLLRHPQYREVRSAVGIGI